MVYESSWTSPTFLLSGKYLIFVFIYEDKSCLESNTFKISYRPNRVYDLSKSSYIVELSRELLNLGTWLQRQKVLKIDNSTKKMLILIMGCISHSEKATSFYPKTNDFWHSIMKTKLV